MYNGGTKEAQRGLMLIFYVLLPGFRCTPVVHGLEGRRRNGLVGGGGGRGGGGLRFLNPCRFSRLLRFQHRRRRNDGVVNPALAFPPVPGLNHGDKHLLPRGGSRPYCVARGSVVSVAGANQGSRWRLVQDSHGRLKLSRLATIKTSPHSIMSTELAVLRASRRYVGACGAQYRQSPCSTGSAFQYSTASASLSTAVSGPTHIVRRRRSAFAARKSTSHANAPNRSPCVNWRTFGRLRISSTARVPPAPGACLIATPSIMRTPSGSR